MHSIQISQLGKVDVVFNPSEILPKVYSLVVAELSAAHVPMVTYDFANMFWRQVHFLCFDKAELSLFCIALCLELLPLARCV